ncbi:iron(III) transport system permease protein [Fodinibius roseus]|uniref:Iron(III) transport system permease protein n=1 Tax=Fodinibius roseus TaxID=1194090 RepID=A0A1M5GIW1_9BACT|nr:iron ABC transporter permease [Fodinibius roseus]SHG03633.1 iron(III) transport system permease protein [Fodinibius roseus]
MIAIGVLLPLVYLLIRAFNASPDMLSNVIFRMRNLRLLGNTLLLAGGVLALDILIALPLAYLSVRCRIRARRLITLLGVLPLAMPGYIMAYALLGLGGYNGTFHAWFGWNFPRISGFEGSLIVLTICTFPYLYLNIRTALMGLDQSIEEASRSLGHDARATFFRVILPQLKPALLAGGLLVCLHVIGDFGTVSLMRFETFSYALYLQYLSAYDRIYAAWLALMLLALTTGALVLEYRLLKQAIFHRLGRGSARTNTFLELGPWAVPAYLFVIVLFLVAVLLPVSSIGFWLNEASLAAMAGNLFDAFLNSVKASAPAALLTTLMALPLAYIGVRYRTKLSNPLERVAYLGYATPPLAFALALVFFSLYVSSWLYQSLLLLVIAYSLHFLAEAIGPVRSALYQAPPQLEEAAQSMGYSSFKSFFKVTLPLLRGGMIAATSLVFLSAMKELSITFLLSPIGFDTLALRVWSYTGEAMFAEAAPFALAILLFSSLFVGFLFSKEWKKT